MPYGKKLYKNSSRVYASDIIYDEMEEKLQSEINADVKADVDILKDHDGVITGEKTYSGSVATILDAEYEMPLKSCVVNIEPVQDLHGQSSPYPPGGGKNLLPTTFPSNVINGYIQDSGYISSSVNRRVFAIPCEQNTSYVASNSPRLAWTLGVSNSLPVVGGSCTRIGSMANRDELSFNSGENTYIIIDFPTESAFLNHEADNKCMIEKGSSATTFAPYSNICPISGWTGCNISHSGADTSDPTVIPISWQSTAGTVYGGTLDVTSGVLTVDSAMVDLGTLAWGKGGSYNNLFYAFLSSFPYAMKVKNYDNTPATNIKCSNYDILSYTGMNVDDTITAGVAIRMSDSTLRVKDSVYASFNVDTFKVAMSGVQLVYELATPQTYQLTPTEVTTLLGQNNFWSDTGDISVSYGGLISVIDRSIDTLTDRLDNLKADQIKAKGLGEVEAEPGDIVTVTDAAEFPVKDLTVGIEPAQDLHGYENPWPAGGGKNKFQTTGVTTTTDGVTYTVNADGTIAVSGTANGVAQFFAGSANVAGINGTITVSGIGSATNIVFDDIVLKDSNNATVYYTGAVTSSSKTIDLSQYPSAVKINVYFKRNTNAVVSGTIKPQIEAGGSATTFAPYSNECPISGWTGCNVSRMGKNLLPMTVENLKSINVGGTWNGNVYTYNNMTFTLILEDDNVAGIRVNGTSYSSYNYFYITSQFQAKSGSEYIISGSPQTPSSTTWRFWVESTLAFPSGNRLSDDSAINSRRTAFGDETVPVYIQIFAGQTLNNAVFYPMIRLASDSDSTYEPYSGVTIPISWQSEAGTVYGGTLDVTSGVLTVTMASVDLGTLEWTYIQTGYMQSLSLSGTIKTVATRTQRLYCSIYSDVTDGRSYADVSDKSIYNVDVSPYLICVKDSSYTDADIFTTAMSGVQLVYELATPQTYQLTPTEVTTLLGQNNIWTDCGPIESLTYIGTEATNVQNEIDEFENKLGGIQKSISAIQDNMTTIRNYEPNEFVTVGKNLYIITANVSKGVSLIEGTNCRETTVMEQITNLLNIIASQNS